MNLGPVSNQTGPEGSGFLRKQRLDRVMSVNVRERDSMRERKRLVVLYHPGAGAGRVAAYINELVRRNGVLAHARSEAVRGADDAADVIERIGSIDPIDTVVAAGGDGTVNFVARALLGQGASASLPLGVVPVGTGNAFAASLGIALQTALRTLANGVPAQIDVIRTTHPQAPLALVSLSTGFEARFIHYYAKRRDRWTRFGAGLTALLCAQRQNTFAMSLVLDDKPVTDWGRPIFNAGLYNLPCYGFGWRPWPDADAFDGRGEAVVCAASREYWRILRRGLRTAPPCDVTDPRWSRWRTARIESRDIWQADGELLLPADFEARIAPAALTVIVPPAVAARSILA